MPSLREAPTDYVGNLVYKKGVLDKILIDGGYISGSDMNYHFFVADHLSNVCVVATATGVIEQQNEFSPYGESIDTDIQFTSDNPYKWGGKEWDADQGAYDFGARMYSPTDARWTTMDPLCEKYYSISPYAYCAGNPVNLVDPDGNMLVIIYEKNGKMDYFYFTGIETVIPDDDYVRSVIEAYKYNKENWLNAGNPGDSPAATLVEN